MKNTIKNTLGILIALAVIAPASAVEFKIQEADQSMSGYYKQKIEYQKWKDEQVQKSISAKDSAKSYDDGVEEYQKALRRQAAMAQFASALSTAALSASTQMQQYQAQQNLMIKQEQAQYSKIQTNYTPTNYSSNNFYSNLGKSNNGYPIIDPYADPNYWNRK